METQLRLPKGPSRVSGCHLPSAQGHAAKDRAEASAAACGRARSGSRDARLLAPVAAPALSPWLRSPGLAGPWLACLPLLDSCLCWTPAAGSRAARLVPTAGGAVCLHGVISCYQLSVKIIVLSRQFCYTCLRWGVFC